MSGTVEVHDDLGGFWQSGKVEASMAGMTMVGKFHTTYDAAAGHFYMLWVDNMGGYSQSTAKGWENGAIVYEGEMVMGGQKAAARDSFSKVEDGSMKHVAHVQFDGNWVLMFEETCKKSAK